MANRKNVFQSKVLQKLYSSPARPPREPSPPPIIEPVAKRPEVPIEPRNGTAVCIGDGEMTPGPAQMGRRVYTALPPPGDYCQTGAGISVTLPQPTGTSTPGDQAVFFLQDENSTQSEEEENEAEGTQKRRRRKRRKRKLENTTPREELVVKEGTGQPGGTDEDVPRADPSGERLSKNKKRKLKKKRHKDKLLAMGLVPQAAAVVFTYQRGGNEEEEEEVEEEVFERRSVEVAEFLRTSLDLYISDGLVQVHADRPGVPPMALQGLLTRISSGIVPPADLSRLHKLKSLVQLKDRAQLASALEELQHSSLSPEETTAVASLIQYWITDILTLSDGNTSYS